MMKRCGGLGKTEQFMKDSAVGKRRERGGGPAGLSSLFVVMITIWIKTEDEEDLVEEVLGHGHAQTWTKLRPSWPFAPKP